MIGLDTNTLVALLVSSQTEHRQARQWLESCADSLCTTPVNIGEFLRLTTHSRVFSRPLSITAAVRLLATFVDDFEVDVLDESPDWWRELNELEGAVAPLRGNDVFDARIALCLKHSRVSVICTRDEGFSRFSFLKRIAF